MAGACDILGISKIEEQPTERASGATLAIIESFVDDDELVRRMIGLGPEIGAVRLFAES